MGGAVMRALELSALIGATVFVLTMWILIMVHYSHSPETTTETTEDH